MQCPGDFEQLPTWRLAVPVTRTLNQSSKYFVGKEKIQMALVEILYVIKYDEINKDLAKAFKNLDLWSSS